MTNKVRDILSAEQSFEEVKQSTIDSYRDLFPIETNQYKVDLDDVWIDDKLDPYDYQQQKDVKMQRKSWTVPVYGKFSLTDKATGKVLNKVNKYKISDLPKLTPRNTYIWQGAEYQPVNLLRRKPGVYLRTTESQEVESFFNLSKGINFKVKYDPRNLEFYSIIGPTKSTLSTYAFLKVFDVPDTTIRKAWGDDVFKNSAKATYGKDIEKLYNIVFQKPPLDEQTAKQELKTYFAGTEMDPIISKAFLGNAYTSVTPEAILDATTQSLKISRGQHTPMNSESLYFKSFHTMEDFIKESFKQEKRDIQRKIKRNIGTKEDLSQILYRPALSTPLKRLFSLSVVRFPEQTNPLHIIDEGMKTTLIGEGGIQDEHTITAQMRDVDLSSAGFLDPIQTPEGSTVGIINFLTLATAKRGTELVTKLTDLKTGKISHYSPAEIIDKVVLFPGQTGDSKLKAIKNGQFVYTDRKDADYQFPAIKQMFGVSTNLVPFLHSIYGARAGIGSKYSLQATSLTNREQPLVVASAEGVPVTKIIGDGISEVAEVNGTVSKVGPDFIEITEEDGKKHKQFFYKNFYLNEKNFLDSTPVVAEGDKIKTGTPIAELNYVKNGQLALGTNLKSAYLPYKGLNQLDAIVISDTASKKLTSEHVYQYDIETDDETFNDLRKYNALYPGKLTKEQRDKLSANGLARVGQIVEPGDTLATILKYKKDSPEDLVLGRLSRGLVNRYKDNSLTWDRVEKGEISDVVQGKNHISIFVKAKEPARVGDKISGLAGNKGTISAVIPDEQMPSIKGEKSPLDILLPVTGVITRLNPSQIYETLAGKAAKKMGKQILVENFGTDDQFKDITKLLDKLNLSDTDTVHDPIDNIDIPEVLTGYQYFYKLRHQALDKASGRYKGTYSVLDQPVRGGPEGTKSMDVLTYYSLLAHGANEMIKDVARKSERNDELWRAIELGEAVPPPKPTFAYDTFLGYLNALGVNVQKNGTQLKLLPFTSKDIKKMSNGELENAKMLDRNLRPEKGGLFDPIKTGGLLGSETKWTHIQLSEPLPNPIMEKSIIALLGIQKKEYDKIVNGTLFVTPTGELTEESKPKNLTGGNAIQKMLSGVDLNFELDQAQKGAADLTGTDLDKLNRKIRSIQSLKTVGVKNPADAYMLDVIPVLPPKMRPIYPLADGSLETSDFNYLYRDIVLSNKLLNEANDLKLPADSIKDLKSSLYDSVKSLYGLGDPSSSNYQKRNGLLTLLAGTSSPKEGFFQNKLLNKEQDLVGRSVIIPANDLHIDEVGIPERLAWNMFKPFAIREYTSRGYSPADALSRINNQTPEAKKFLEIAMSKHPVLLNRAPSLHKYSIMAFKPILVEGEGMKINPLVAIGFNADFDGDQMTAHIPVSPKAIEEAWKFLPSKQVINPSTGKYMLMPQEDSMAGIYRMSKTPAGRKVINDVLPEGVNITGPLDKKNLQNLLVTSGKQDSTASAVAVDNLKRLGDEYGFQSGYTIKLKDLKPIIDNTTINSYMKTFFAETDPNKRIQTLYDLGSKLDKDLSTKHEDNVFVEQANAGIRGKMFNARQLLSTPVMSQDAEGNPIPMFINKPYTVGLSLPDYFISSKGARRALIEKGVETAVPGEMAKEFAAAAIDYKVTEVDCGATSGLELPTDNPDIQDRFLAKNVIVGGKVIARRNQLVDPALVESLRKNKITNVEVRSPLNCRSVSGTCVKCAGLGANGQPAKIGDFYGIYAAQSLSEPATQAALSSPHKGGIAQEKKLVGLEKIRTLLSMPKEFPGQALVSEHSGKITEVKVSPDKTDIFIGENLYTAPVGVSSVVKPGQEIQIGDRLTTGLINPNDVYKTKGLPAMRNYLRDELLQSYRAEGVSVKSNIIESMVAAATKAGKVLRSGDSAFVPGDFIRLAQAEEYNRQKSVEIPSLDSLGRRLAENTYGKVEGDKIDAAFLREMKSQKKKTVNVKIDPMEVEPFLRGIGQVPLAKEDWLTRMAYQRIKDTVEEGVARGWNSDLAGYSPIPQYITGDFGSSLKGKFGKTNE